MLLNYEIQAVPEIELHNSIDHVNQAKLTENPHDLTVLLFYDHKSLVSEECPQIQCATSLLSSFMDASNCSKSSGILSLLPSDAVPGGRLLVSGIGELDGDVDDVFLYASAAKKAFTKAKSLLKSSSGSILLLIQSPPFKSWLRDGRKVLAGQYEKYLSVSTLSALSSLHTSLEERDRVDYMEKNTKRIDCILVGDHCSVIDQPTFNASSIVSLERGRRLARDIGGSDPERMSPQSITETIQSVFSSVDNVALSIEDCPTLLKKEYPLLHAVARASLADSASKRHWPRVIHLEYRSPVQAEVEENLFMVGKGVTYDTGGADLKVGGNMVGMSRDKGGASALVGWMLSLSELRPSNINVKMSLAFVRNSIGYDSYVADEIISSRSGCRVRVGNTDAEGRMAMADLLGRQREQVLGERPENARMITCATLTGHVIRCYGPYAAALDNGPASEAGIAKRLAANSDLFAEGMEVSRMRKDDYEYVTPNPSSQQGTDVLQANRTASTMTSRGHQYPVAFLINASGLIKNGRSSTYPIPYTHLDIAGAAESSLSVPHSPMTGAPILALNATFVKEGLQKKEQ